MEKTVGRPRIKVDIEILSQVRNQYPKMKWNDLAGKYYVRTGVYVPFMTLWRRYKEIG